MKRIGYPPAWLWVFICSFMAFSIGVHLAYEDPKKHFDRGVLCGTLAHQHIVEERLAGKNPEGSVEAIFRRVYAMDGLDKAYLPKSVKQPVTAPTRSPRMAYWMATPVTVRFDQIGSNSWVRGADWTDPSIEIGFAPDGTVVWREKPPYQKPRGAEHQ